MFDYNRPFIWKNGVMSDLGTIEGYNMGDAKAINNNEIVVGLIHVKNNISSWRAVLWEKGTITTLVETTSIANGINDLGQIVGAFKNNAGEWRAFIWENGTATDLGIEGGYAIDINNNNQIVGRTLLGHNSPFLLEDGNVTDLSLPEEYTGQASAINNKGEIVGFSQNMSYETRAVIWQNGEYAYLDDLIPLDSGVEYLAEATDINDKGQIVAYGVIGGYAHGFILTPIPTIENILDFFYKSVSDSSLTGNGPGNSANNRLNALRKMLEMAGDLIAIDDIEGACVQLKAALKKCDGVSPPSDFVTGFSAPKLNEMISDLMPELGCE